jgi:uncharacterized protein
MEYFFYALIGVATGFFSGLFGIGGGSIRIPLLALAGMPLVNAFATNMFAIPFSSGTGAFVQRRNISWSIVKKFTLGAVFGILIATFLVGIVHSKILAVVFFFVAIITVFGLYLDSISHRIYEKIMPTFANLFMGGFLSNFIVGLRGGSGGTMFPPVLRAMHVEMHHAIATSLFTGIFTSVAALSLYFFRGQVLVLPAVIVAFTGIIGSYFGSGLSIKTDSKFLKAGLAVIVVVLAIVVLYKETAW